MRAFSILVFQRSLVLLVGLPSEVDGPDPANEDEAQERLQEADDQAVDQEVVTLVHVEEADDPGAEAGPDDVDDENEESHRAVELAFEALVVHFLELFHLVDF